MTDLFDMHCHLNFAENACSLAVQAAGRISALSATVTPRDFLDAREAFAPFPHIQVGLGIHPWWVANGQISDHDLELFSSLAQEARIIGEVGLDFHGKRRETKEQQIEAFTRVLEALGDGKRRVVSLHVVKAYAEAFSLISSSGAPGTTTFIFHWFQGSNDDFTRAVNQGFYFSVSSRMMRNEKGRYYARELPDTSLLIETDAPAQAGDAWSVEAWERQLDETLCEVAAVRGTTPQAMRDTVAANSARLLEGVTK